MGGPPSKGTAKDKRLKANKATTPPARPITPPVMPVAPTPQKKSTKGSK